jgi:hypothetical protein
MEKGVGAFTNDENIVRHHICKFRQLPPSQIPEADHIPAAHCLDVIRQQLMCQPDTGILGQVWWDKSAPKAFVDFNTDHKCKNFDAIRQWAEERQIPETVPMDFLKPPVNGDAIYDAIP